MADHSNQRFFRDSRRAKFRTFGANLSWLVLTMLLTGFVHSQQPEADHISELKGSTFKEQIQMFFSTPLQRAISEGLKPDGDLTEELRKLNNYPVKSKKDALAICDAIEKLPSLQLDDQTRDSALQELVSLFRNVENANVPAFHVLGTQGLTKLFEIFDNLSSETEGNRKDNSSTLMLMLKIFAIYGTREGADKVADAALQPIAPDDYMWHGIFSTFSQGHSQKDHLFNRFQSAIPESFAGVALLDISNELSCSGKLDKHPFDTEQGKSRLESWISDRDPQKYSYAVSATVALAFISNPARDRLMALAMDHSDATVQIEASWAASKIGREAGLKVLSRFCLDVNHSEQAQRYLMELDREDMIPSEAKEPSFRAKSEFASWLAHPNELGKAPDELEIIDQRQLAWPPEKETSQFFLIRYLMRDDTGLGEDDSECGLVGSMTFCLFSYKLCERPPEDAYAIHCYWEMTNQDLIEETEVTDATEYQSLLRQWKGNALKDASIIFVAEISPKLKTKNRLIGLASAKMDGKIGWIVLDGAQSQWYPTDEQPSGTSATSVLKIHVGRQLLGFQNQPDRKTFLLANRPERPPKELIVNFETYLKELDSASQQRKAELVGSYGLLTRHFEKYLKAVTLVNERETDQELIVVYERVLRAAETIEHREDCYVFESSGILVDHLNEYVNAITKAGRKSEVAGLITLLSPHLDHNLGYGILGRAAFDAGLFETAEIYFTQLRSNYKNYPRSDEMSQLAELWSNRGEVQQARDLLLDCMQQLVKEIKASKYASDRKMFADAYQHHRTTYLQLFPDGEKELVDQNLPSLPNP